MASAEFVDPYLDPETGLLRNKVGAQTKVALDEAEGDLSFARLVQLMDHPVKPTGDLDAKSATEILDLMGTLNRDFRKTIVMVTHDPRAAERAGVQHHLEKGVLRD